MSKEFKTSLFDCCPVGLCLKGFCCTCVLAGQNHHRITGTSREEPPVFSGWCFGWCAMTSCCGIGWVLQMIDRQTMADKYDLKNNVCGGCLKAFCCQCCEAIQTSKELDYVLLENQAGNGYVAPEKMNAYPQQQ